MKLALICDSHWGCRGDSIAFHDKKKLFLDNIFFPYLKNNCITNVIHLGDLTDRRKYVNYNTANRLRHDFLNPMAEMNLDVTFLCGNHDSYFKSTNAVNSLQELVSHYENFVICDTDAMEAYYDGLYVLLLPWICDENRSRIMARIEMTDAKVAFGHLELKGFEMFKGMISPCGDDDSLFSKFDMVCSGHFHHKSSVGNIQYLGSIDEMTWADYDDPRGFHILDTETLKLSFIQNPYRMFKKVYYDDREGNLGLAKQRETEFESCMVKVIVGNKTNPSLYEWFIEKIEKQNPLNLQILDDGGLKTIIDTPAMNDAEDTLSMIFNYIDGLNLKDDEKIGVKTLITELYDRL